MKNYLSYGGGVNSTALVLLLLEENWDFEAVYVDHGCDWPETRKYVAWFSKHTPITVIRPNYTVGRSRFHAEPRTYDSLYEYCWVRSILPTMQRRFCTLNFKVNPVQQYIERPCYMLLGIDAGESHRAKLYYDDGIERRHPLIEYGIDRNGCVEIIKKSGLPVPPKSGCFFCPYQRPAEWRLLRRKHPDLFCRAKNLEDRNRERRRGENKRELALWVGGHFLDEIVNESQQELFKEYEYPPCYCGL